MAQTLKNSDRNAVHTRVLRDAFAPRFAAIGKRCAAHLEAKAKAEHPRFYELWENEQNRPYLQKSVFYTPYRDRGCGMFSPGYGRTQVNGAERTWRHETCEVLRFDVPATYAGADRIVTDESILDDYRALWDEYMAAHTKVSALLAQYKTRERLAEDLPGFAKYVPPASKPNVPAVAVAYVLKELAALGVPAEV